MLHCSKMRGRLPGGMRGRRYGRPSGERRDGCLAPMPAISAVTDSAINNLPDDVDLVITHRDLTER
ncbi:hypothetical protein JK228_15375, partial [Serratia rubidaea]|nr:hypothetical protein [Serratia rubidaea]